MNTEHILRTLGIEESNLGGFAGEWVGSGPDIEVFTPIDGSRLGTVREVTEAEYDEIVDRAHAAFLEWRKLPAPKRGEIVRQLGNKLREEYLIVISEPKEDFVDGFELAEYAERVATS
ncbi:MAG: aldehyde dehydrogenase family protein, partial [Longimicrobiales bacterium]